MVKIMVTDGGPHPADAWADTTSQMIVDTLLPDNNPNNLSDVATELRAAKRKLRMVLFDIMLEHHTKVQKVERDALPKKIKTVKEAGIHADHDLTPIDPKEHVDSIYDKVQAAFDATPWKDHLNKPDVIRWAKHQIGQHTVDVIHIERRWHHDRIKAAPAALPAPKGA